MRWDRPGVPLGWYIGSSGSGTGLEYWSHSQVLSDAGLVALDEGDNGAGRQSSGESEC